MTKTVDASADELREKLGLKRYNDERDENARTYLTRVLTATGGDRVTAAAVAGLNRTHLQALIKRHGVKVPMNPKTRGRRRKAKSREARETETADSGVDW